MARPDATAAAAIDQPVVRPAFFCYLDVVDDPVRATTAGKNITFSGTGIADLDGFTYEAIASSLVDVSPVKSAAGGSETVTVRLSGIRGLDTDMLNALGNVANWRGRVARLWRMIRDEAGTQQGAIQHYYTGYMIALDIEGDETSQAIVLKIESYLATFSQASNRTYLDQADFDSGDLSAKAAIAIANGVSGNPITGNTPAGGYGGGNGSGVWGAFNNVRPV